MRMGMHIKALDRASEDDRYTQYNREHGGISAYPEQKSQKPTVQLVRSQVRFDNPSSLYCNSTTQQPLSEEERPLIRGPAL